MPIRPTYPRSILLALVAGAPLLLAACESSNTMSATERTDRSMRGGSMSTDRSTNTGDVSRDRSGMATERTIDRSTDRSTGDRWSNPGTGGSSGTGSSGTGTTGDMPGGTGSDR